MKDITIIVPIHKYDEQIEEMLTNALKSLPSKTKVILSCASNIYSSLENKINNYIKVISIDGTSFQELVNNGVDNVDTKWFSILEFDDEYTPIWFNEVEKYIEYNPSVSVFLPLTDLKEFDTKKFIGYGNEAVWASSFSTEIGYIDNECLNNFFDFYLTGLVCNTNDWKENGGLKKSIELTFWYEFLLRMTHLQKKIFVIPRIGYVHNLNRADSLLKIYSEKFDEKTVQAYIDLAKQEQFFKNDRNKTIENNEEGE